jgi:topoisomerase IA-like protein
VGRYDTRRKSRKRANSFRRTRREQSLLLQQAIHSLEEEIAKAGPKVEAKKAKQTSDVAADATPEPKSPAKIDVRSAAPRRWDGITFESVRSQVGRWLRRR